MLLWAGVSFVFGVRSAVFLGGWLPGVALRPLMAAWGPDVTIYQGDLDCNLTTCARTIRQISVEAIRCLLEGGCRGGLRFQRGVSGGESCNQRRRLECKDRLPSWDW